MFLSLTRSSEYSTFQDSFRNPTYDTKCQAGHTCCFFIFCNLLLQVLVYTIYTLLHCITFLRRLLSLSILVARPTFYRIGPSSIFLHSLSGDFRLLFLSHCLTLFSSSTLAQHALFSVGLSSYPSQYDQ